MTGLFRGSGIRTPPLIAEEEARLACLAEYGFDANAFEPALDPIVALAARMFDAPMAVVNLIGRDSVSLAANCGIGALDPALAGRDISFCAHAITGDDILLVEDATLDARFHDNPLVTGPSNFRFYAGVPLRAPSGHGLGSLCIIDTRARTGLSEQDLTHLRELAGLVLDKLELRRLDVAQRVSQARFEHIASTSPDAIICTDEGGAVTVWNASAAAMFGYDASEMLGQPIERVVPQDLHTTILEDRKRAARGAPPKLIGRSLEFVGLRRDGSQFPAEFSSSGWREGSSCSFGAIIRDISERRRSEDRLFNLANYDQLTGLPNRGVLMQRIAEELSHDRPASLILVELDKFRIINDTVGNVVGERLLRQAGERLSACARGIDTITRLEGEEFAILLPGMADPLHAASVADAAIGALTAPFNIDGHDLLIGAAAGLAISPAHGQDPEELLANAHLALHEAKRGGSSARRLFTQDMRQAAVARREQDIEIRRAIANHELELHYQPQVRLTDGLVMGAEALLRWRHPTRGLVSPAAFLPLLEGGLLAATVGEWVIDTACQQAAAWRRSGARDFRIGVNLFSAQFRTGNLVASVDRALARSGLPAEALELELTENIIIDGDEALMTPLRALRARGVQIAFDDYGTGYASLSLLKHLPITRLKIDQSFVRTMCSNTSDEAVVSAVLFLARSFQLEVIAEGIETVEQRDALQRMGCPEGQGYLFGKAMHPAEFGAFIASGSTDLRVAG